MALMGRAVTFIPTQDCDKIARPSAKARRFGGTVVYVNKPNKYFTVEYERRGYTMRESFKFAEIGKVVKVHGNKANC